MKNKTVINYPLITKDSKGNLVHYKYSNGTECWYEYDENNNLIHAKNTSGYECWYDSKGNEIPNPNIVTEVTLEDIAKKFGVDAKSLKIKK